MTKDWKADNDDYNNSDDDSSEDIDDDDTNCKLISSKMSRGSGPIFSIYLDTNIDDDKDDNNEDDDVGDDDGDDDTFSNRAVGAKFMLI